MIEREKRIYFEHYRPDGEKNYSLKYAKLAFKNKSKSGYYTSRSNRVIDNYQPYNRGYETSRNFKSNYFKLKK